MGYYGLPYYLSVTLKKSSILITIKNNRKNSWVLILRIRTRFALFIKWDTSVICYI